MRKFTKICLITSLVLILIGGTICVIGAVSGGWKLVRKIEGNGRWWQMIEQVSDDDWVDRWNYDWDEMEAEIEEMAEGESKAVDVLSDIEMENVNDLEINIGGAALYVQESEDGTLGFRAEGKGKYKCYESGGVLHVEGAERNPVLNNDERVYLTIPKDMTFGEVTVNVGAGLVELAAIEADEVELAIGAGRIDAEGIIGRSLQVDTGAGQAVLKNIEVDELNLEVDMGESRLEGCVAEEIEVECGMGRTQLILTNSEEDFNYEISCGAGSVNIGDRSYTAVADDTYIDNDASRECSLECAMGSIDISFE